MSDKQDVMIALLREVLAKLDDIPEPSEGGTPSLEGIERDLDRLKEGQKIILAAIGEVYARLDATETLPAYMLEHGAAELLRENYPEHGPQPKAMEALATVKQRVGSYDTAKLNDLAQFYRDKVASGDPYAHQATEALKLVEQQLSERRATKEPDPEQKGMREA